MSALCILKIVHTVTAALVYYLFCASLAQTDKAYFCVELLRGVRCSLHCFDLNTRVSYGVLLQGFANLGKVINVDINRASALGFI